MVSDTADNCTQIGNWALTNITKEQARIELFFKLTRKNLTALSAFPISPTFDPCFKKFCHSFTRMEKEYLSGIKNPSGWGNQMVKWGSALTKNIELL